MTIKLSLPLPPTAEDAVRAGTKRYFSGVPCKNGHLSERYVSGRYCVTCNHLSAEKHKLSEIGKQKIADRIARQKSTGEWESMAKNRQLRHKYKIGIDEYNVMLKAQNGVCAICKTEEPKFTPWKGERYSLAVDHCHTTGKIRGLLCGFCNTALGKFRDDVKVLENAIAYLKNGGAIYD